MIGILSPDEMQAGYHMDTGDRMQDSEIGILILWGNRLIMAQPKFARSL
jgi:hypothetical protein